MRGRAHRLAAGLALALLSGCATATLYQPSVTPRGYGYSEQAVEQDRTRISFRGNSLTDRETVETYLLYRAAELTLARGFDHFILVERDTEARSRYESSGRSFYRYPGFYPHWTYYSPRWGWRPWYDPFFDNPGSYRQVTRYEATAEIRFGRGPRPDDPKAFDARDVMRNLEGRVARPPAQ